MIEDRDILLVLNSNEKMLNRENPRSTKDNIVNERLILSRYFIIFMKINIKSTVIRTTDIKRNLSEVISMPFNLKLKFLKSSHNLLYEKNANIKSEVTAA